MFLATLQTLIPVALGIGIAFVIVLAVRNLGQLTRVLRRGRKVFSGAHKPEQDDTTHGTVLDATEQLIWKVDETGVMHWANRAFQTRASDSGEALTRISAREDLKERQTKRFEIPSTDGLQWFDILWVADGARRIYFAQNVTNAAKTEDMHRKFVNAVGRTFAQLSDGLAIFGADQKLAMYNPALVEMTGLAPDYLTNRPSLVAVLDRLRSNRILPEPRDFAEWRDAFIGADCSGKTKSQSEYWSQPDGVTFRVTGHRHGDDSFAMTFEDVTADISLTRQFRTDIKVGQAVLDALPDAIAVFSEVGTLIMSNASYNRMWGADDNLLLSDRELETELDIWTDHCVHSKIWAELRARVADKGRWHDWSGEAMLLSGRSITCSAQVLMGGIWMVRFVAAQPAKATLHSFPEKVAQYRISK